MNVLNSETAAALRLLKKAMEEFGNSSEGNCILAVAEMVFSEGPEAQKQLIREKCAKQSESFLSMERPDGLSAPCGGSHYAQGGKRSRTHFDRGSLRTIIQKMVRGARPLTRWNSRVKGQRN